ncbi:hypothetical protein WMY93_016324 [Mugilogobius chulae]|uniref:Uncharacterized protein n=1 Tax=Mugilogobius chulae TaxID=88201 RepID=A0AAW0NTS7_9GOBI
MRKRRRRGREQKERKKIMEGRERRNRRKKEESQRRGKKKQVKGRKADTQSGTKPKSQPRPHPHSQPAHAHGTNARTLPPSEDTCRETGHPTGLPRSLAETGALQRSRGRYNGGDVKRTAQVIAREEWTVEAQWAQRTKRTGAVHLLEETRSQGPSSGAVCGTRESSYAARLPET